MANHPSAKKRHRQSLKRREHNRHYRTRLRGAVKSVRQAVEADDKEKAEELLAPTLSLVDRVAGKGIVHRNKAARTKSRLTKAVRGLG